MIQDSTVYQHQHMIFIIISKQINLSRPVSFKNFAPKQSDRTWLCTSITLVLKTVESCSKVQKIQQVFWYAIKKILVGG